MKKSVPSFYHSVGILQPFYANNSHQKYRFHILDFWISIPPTQRECTSFFLFWDWSLISILVLEWLLHALLSFLLEKMGVTLIRDNFWEESGQPKELLSLQVPGTGAWFGHSAVTSFHLVQFYCLNFSFKNIIIKKYFCLNIGYLHDTINYFISFYS